MAFLVAMFASFNAQARSGGGATVNTDILLVQFHEQPVTEYRGEVDGLSATSRDATGQRLDPESPASLVYRDWLRARQDQHLAKISGNVGRQVDVIFRYSILLNGVAIRAQAGDLKRIKALGAVKAVTFDVNYPLHTDRGPQWIGADTIWDGNGTGGLGDTRGEGIVIGVLDTGVNFGHPSYSDNPDDGHVYANPNAPDFLGWCHPDHPEFDAAYTCNNKLIGAWDFVDAVSIENDGPVDDDGHGSHTSSTAGGNTLSSPAISGVAPHANIIVYDTCYIPASGPPATCPFSATSAAAEQALIDGVDVINYSIGGGTTPWSEFDIDSFFLDLVANGIFVSASAGNSGPGAGTTGHNGPWVSASGASTHDRQGVENMLIDMSGGDTAPPADIAGQSRTAGYGPETIFYAGDFSNGDPDPEQCLNPFPAGTWSDGEIVLCDRGEIARVLKCSNVAAGGAGGCILADISANPGPAADPHVIPATHVSQADGDVLRAWLASGNGHMGEITNSTIIVNPAVADIMARFSSRGPAPIDVIKPDVASPGVNIFAAVQAGGIPGFPGPDFGNISGTSMASPHTAGAAALLMALHPAWSPSEVKSALMSTAETAGVLKEDDETPADPFDRGGGRVDLSAAAQAGLILDETEANYLAANPDTGGDPRTLNLATMMDSKCVIVCTFTRTVKNARSFTTDWTFTQTGGTNLTITADPAAFSLAAGATQEIEFTVTITGGSDFRFGEGTFDEDGVSASSAHFTVAVNETALSIDAINIESLERSGSTVLEGVRTTGAADLQLTFAGVVPLERSRDEVAQDPTNSNAFDNDIGTVTYWLNGLVGNRRIHASTFDSDAPDLDLFVGRDANTDGIPQANEVVCLSTTPTADEECEIMDPADGDWWVRVQNWHGSGAPTDSITLHFGAVGPADEGNFSAVPSNDSPDPGEAFDVTVDWIFGPTGGNGAFIGVMDVGTSPGNPDDLGTVTVDFFNDRLIFSGFE